MSVEIPGEKILWEGPLFGRLTKASKNHLIRRHGWHHQSYSNNSNKTNHETDADSDQTIGSHRRHTKRLALVWPNKSGPQFSVDDASAAHIRPYPRDLTDVLDDKVRLSDLLCSSQATEMLLPTRVVSLQDIDPKKLYFVKHRHGAQGKSVYVMNSTELKEWWSNKEDRTRDQFVVQEEVSPHTYEGRKFVMRSHILVWHTSRNTVNHHNIRNHISSHPTFHSHVSDTVIVLHHASSYDPDTQDRASHISQVGKKHPAPQLLKELPRAHPAIAMHDVIKAASRQVVLTYETWLDERIAAEPPSGKRNASATVIAPETTCFALVGVDWLLQKSSKNRHDNDNKAELKLCEINSHPALGWGTMANVPPHVFAGLLEESLDLLLQPTVVPLS